MCVLGVGGGAGGGGLITASDQAVRAVHKCNNWLIF